MVKIEDAGHDQPNAMTNDAGDWFYPDGPEDAEWFAREHGAWPAIRARDDDNHLDADELAAGR